MHLAESGSRAGHLVESGSRAVHLDKCGSRAVHLDKCGSRATHVDECGSRAMHLDECGEIEQRILVNLVAMLTCIRWATRRSTLTCSALLSEINPTRTKVIEFLVFCMIFSVT